MGKIFLNEESYGGGDAEFELYDYAYANGNIQFDLNLMNNANYMFEYEFKANSYANNLIITGDYRIGTCFYSNKLYLNGEDISLSGVNFTSKHKVVNNNANGKVELDGAEVGTYVYYEVGHYLFRRSSGGGYSNFAGRFYYYKVTDKSTGNVIMWLKPAAIKVMGYKIAEGFYDVIGGNWFTGTGLTVGNETS